PTLFTRFDFADDGNLAYPAAAPSSGYLGQVWEASVAEFHYAGPFRPVTWAVWTAEANVLGPHELPRRLERLVWCALATWMLLWLFAELDVPPLGALLVAALATWNPFRGEIWIGLGLTEAIAMPPALLGLVCAARAARSARPWPWDLAGVVCLLLCLGTKN